MRHTRRTSDSSPWGRLAGLLTGCGITLVGVIGQLDPHVILLRAATGAAVVGLTVALGTAVIRATAARERLRRH